MADMKVDYTAGLTAVLTVVQWGLQLVDKTVGKMAVQKVESWAG